MASLRAAGALPEVAPREPVETRVDVAGGTDAAARLDDTAAATEAPGSEAAPRSALSGPTGATVTRSDRRARRR